MRNDRGIFIVLTDQAPAAEAIATIQYWSGGTASPSAAGAFIARAGDVAVQGVADARGRVVEAAGADALCGGQGQRLAMRAHGVDLLMDPSEVSSGAAWALQAAHTCARALRNCADSHPEGVGSSSPHRVVDSDLCENRLVQDAKLAGCKSCAKTHKTARKIREKTVR